MLQNPPRLILAPLTVWFFGVASAEPPDAPEGFRWKRMDRFSDEFDGERLDGTKWHDHFPGWVGRPPGRFLPGNVTLDGGHLRIESNQLPEPEPVPGAKPKPGQPTPQFTIGCGAIQSKAADALYGYYECRMKASRIPTSSTFWLINTLPRPDGTRLRTELDIQECIGGAQRWKAFADHMMGNTHVTLYPKEEADGQVSGQANGQVSKQDDAPEGRPEPATVKAGGRAKLSSGVADEFHTYGCWWVDGNTMHFYADGEPVFTINVSDEVVEAPFHQPMRLNLVCETYAWETTPTTSQLADTENNFTLYDWVRCYELVKDAE